MPIGIERADSGFRRSNEYFVIDNNVKKLFIFVVALCALSTALAHAQKDVEVERPGQGIVAALDDHGDYYLHPDGREIAFYRKRGVYALSTNEARSASSIDTISRLQANYGQRVDKVLQHRLGAIQVVRIDNSQRAKGGRNQSFNITPSMLQALDSSIADVQPVLANVRGRGDILITSKLMFKLRDNQATQAVLEAVLTRHKLSFERRVLGPGAIYIASGSSNAAVSSRFALVRRVMREAHVEWAQPLFKSKPYKTSFEPNDPLFTDQWHLRNTGQGGSRCDTDCDANNAWDIDDANGVGAVSGAGTVIAIIDDGVQLDHEDLTIWINAGESVDDGIDNDNNGYIDDINGWDFVDDDSSAAGSCGEDATRGTDNDPSPQPFTACVNANGDDVKQDDHGTAVAGIAAAIGNNNTGVAGVAFSATVLPIRLISEFDADPDDDFCARVIEAMTYAGLYADVINNSWELEQGTCPGLDTTIGQIVDGTLPSVGGNAQRRAGKGAPVVFAAGNNGSGWVKVTVPVSAGKHAYEWRFLRSDFPIDDFNEDDSVWLDDITWPDGATEGFESFASFPSKGQGFTSAWALNQCNDLCDQNLGARDPVWEIESRPQYVRSGAKSAYLDAFDSDCGYSYLSIIRDGPAGEISFWVWVSTDTTVDSDAFEFLVDGEEKLSYGDLPRIIDNAVAYPANVLKTIAVGASDAGDLSGLSTASLTAEERAPYSQFGSALDVLAPSSNQHLGITTTDRAGTDGFGSGAYTSDFGGTSAAAPIVSGIAATMIAAGDLSAADIEARLRATADKIGRRGEGAYDQDGNTRSEFHGYGRVNMYRALLSTLDLVDDPNGPFTCSAEAFSYSLVDDLLLPRYAPQSTEFCAAQGPSVPEDESCYVVPTQNNKVVVFCL